MEIKIIFGFIVFAVVSVSQLFHFIVENGQWLMSIISAWHS